MMRIDRVCWALIVLWLVVTIIVFSSCTSWQVPRGHGNPCAPHGGIWSDSLARCVPRDSTEATR